MTTQEQKAAAARRQREWYERNKGQARKAARERFQRLRAEMLDLLGGRCVRCGYHDRRALEIDHLIPRKETRLKEWHREMSNIREHPEQYQLLCANCHTIKSKGER